MYLHLILIYQADFNISMDNKFLGILYFGFYSASVCAFVESGLSDLIWIAPLHTNFMIGK